MAALVLTWLAISSTVFGQDECENGIKPIYIDFHDRHVNNSLSQIQYGLFVGVGTPSQNQSLWPSLMHNETTFSSPDFCDNSDNPKCQEQTHGVYRPESSDTFDNISRTDYTEQFLRDPDVSTAPARVAQTGNDTLNIFTHYFDPSPPNVTRIESFPLSQLTDFDSDASPWFGLSGHLGLGPSAPVLQRLVDQGEITTRSFGLYVGTAYPRAGGAINGSLTLGGYDSGRIEGEAHNFTLATDYDVLRNETPYRVTIESLVLLDTNNNNDSIALTNSSFEAYLTTDQFSMTFPDAATRAFIAATDTNPDPESNDFSEPTFSLPDDANYTLVITLSTGLQVSIPSNELRNASNASPISGPPESSSPALLGTSFLSHLYLTANYDATPPAFHLNRALPHGPYVMTQPLCASTVPVMAEPVHISGFRANGLIGAVLGGVIGGIGLSFALWWCCIRMRQRQLSRQLGEAEDEELKGAVSIKNGVVRALSSPRSAGGNGGAYSPTAGGGGGTRMKLRGILKRSGRRRDSKGKSRAVRYDGIDGAGGKGSWSGSSDDDHNNEGQGFAMQHFSPVAVPAAYYGHSGDDQQQQQYTDTRGEPADETGYMIGQALSTPSPNAAAAHHHEEQRGRRASDTHAGGDRATLRSISPVSPISDIFSTEPADFPLPTSSHSKSHSHSSSPPPQAAADTYANVSLADDHNDHHAPPAAAFAAGGAGGPGGNMNGSASSFMTPTPSTYSGSSVAFSGEPRTAKRLKVLPVNVVDARGETVRVERVARLGSGRWLRR